MPTALFVSPHLDDVAFSCGGTLAVLAAGGWDVRLVTVFTASVPDPQGFALACQTDKGIGPEVDYMALRRGEDDDFARIAGVADNLRLDLPEAPHRGYGSAAELFAGVHDGDAVWRNVVAGLEGALSEAAPDALFAPQGLGGHVDHVQVLRALEAAAPAAPVLYYRDTPYALRESDAPLWPGLPDGFAEAAVGLGDALGTKLDAAAAYRSQLGFQFGSEERMRATLARFARVEAMRLGVPDRAAEAFLTGEDGIEALAGFAVCPLGATLRT